MTNSKKPAGKSLKKSHAKVTAKETPPSSRDLSDSFAAMDLREDAQRESMRQSEIRAGRAWPMLL